MAAHNQGRCNCAAIPSEYAVTAEQIKRSSEKGDLASRELSDSYALLDVPFGSPKATISNAYSMLTTQYESKSTELPELVQAKERRAWYANVIARLSRARNLLLDVRLQAHHERLFEVWQEHVDPIPGQSDRYKASAEAESANWVQWPPRTWTEDEWRRRRAAARAHEKAEQEVQELAVQNEMPSCVKRYMCEERIERRRKLAEELRLAEETRLAREKREEEMCAICLRHELRDEETALDNRREKRNRRRRIPSNLIMEL